MLGGGGAQGGNVTGSYPATGSKGGYSEGVLKLDNETTLYVFVGGKGTDYSYSNTSTSLKNGGWYGGGRAYSDNSTSYISYTGGGSGFVNIASNASYRPSGYTGLELESGTTTAGNSSFESVSGGSETGHSGNGYARITVI